MQQLLQDATAMTMIAGQRQRQRQQDLHQQQVVVSQVDQRQQRQQLAKSAALVTLPVFLFSSYKYNCRD
ncbi:MAG: hypothetical protein ACRD8W_03200 [Nitrososphaeraceae archaeon]